MGNEFLDCMKISSVDNKCFVAFEYNVDPNGYGGFQVEVHADIGHGKFNAKNADVQFINMEEFVSEFDGFILDRTRKPRLEATYDTYFAFSASGGSVILKYQLGDVVCSQRNSCFYQTGEFEVEQQNLQQFLAGFQLFLAARRDVPNTSRH